MLCIRCRKEIVDNSLFCSFCGKRQVAAPATQRKRHRRPKGSGTVYRMSGHVSKPWVAEQNGNKIGYFASSPEATLALDRFNAQRAPVDVKLYTLQNVYTSFCNSQRYAKLGDSGREGLSVAWSRLRSLAGKRATDIRISHYQNIIDAAIKEKKYKNISGCQLLCMKPSERARYEALQKQPEEPLGYDGKNRIKQLVSHLYAEMMRLEIADKNLAELLVLPKLEKSEKRNFSEDEKAAIFAHGDMLAAKIIILYLETGMRLNELLKLPRKAVDVEKKIIIGGSKTKAGTNRVIPITKKAMPYVLYFYERSKETFIEIDEKPLRDDTFRNAMFYPTLDLLGISHEENGKNVLTPHRARHTFTADAIKSGVSPEALKEILGHAKYNTTVEKYADKLDVSYLQDELSKKLSRR